MPDSERAANLRILPVTAAGSAIINNTPIVAMLVPVVADLGRSAKLAVSRIYMGVSNASVLGGSITLIGTSTNLIVAGLVLATYGVELRVFFPTAVGLPAAIVGVVLMLVLADRFLGTAATDAAAAERPRRLRLRRLRRGGHRADRRARGRGRDARLSAVRGSRLTNLPAVARPGCLPSRVPATGTTCRRRSPARP
jgi:hypothetical protein